MVATKVLASLLIIGFASWYLYIPLPRDIAHPWATQCIYASYRMIGLASSASEWIGIATDTDAMIYLFDKLLFVVQWWGGDYSGDTVMIEEDIFNGIPVRIAQPRVKPSQNDLLRGFVYFHGGGWTIGSTHVLYSLLRRFVEELNVVVVAVDYRLAPRVKFPVPFEDCVKATQHFMVNAEKYGVDGHRIAVGGDSAGGNLAAAVSLKLRDDVLFGFVPKAQVLIYPALQAIDTETPAYQQTFDPHFMSRVGMSWFWSMYITATDNLTTDIATGNHVPLEVKKKMAATIMNHDALGENFHYSPYESPILTDGNVKVWNGIKHVVMNPYFAPLMTNNMSHLPAAFVYTVEHDVLRDEGIWFVQRFKKAGNKVHHLHSPTSFHGNFPFMNILPTVYRHADAIVTFLKQNM